MAETWQTYSTFTAATRAMAGGLFYLMLYGAGKFSIDHAIEK